MQLYLLGLQAFANICCNFTTWVSQQPPPTGTTKEVGKQEVVKS